MQKRTDEQCGNLTDLVKNIVLGFCKINVQYAERLDIYGSVHIRADDCDVANFLLSEHCYNNSHASSPTVTSAQPVDHESVRDYANSSNGCMNQKNLQKITLKPETPVESGKNQRSTGDWSLLQWSNTESTSVNQQRSFPQPVCSNSQPVSATSDIVSQSTNVVSKNFVSNVATNAKGHAIDVKFENENLDSEADINDDQLSNNGSVEILDDDSMEYLYDDNNVPSEYKNDFSNREEQYDAGYDYFAPQYDDSVTSVYQCANVSTHGGYSAKKLKPSASSVGQNVPSCSEKICDFCQERFVSDAELSAHFKQYHQCTRPPEHKKRKTSLRHMDQTVNTTISVSTEENVIKMYKCRFCGLLYRSQDGLKNHENAIHSRNVRYECNFCSQEFFTRQAAYTHRVKFHRLLSKKTQ